MYAQQWDVKRAAAEIDVDYQHLYKAVNGYISPGVRVRERLPLLLNTPLDELFTAESLNTSRTQQVRKLSARYRDPAGAR